ncbi:hypothetical protein LMG7974_00946 [Campylobacter majalis]|uniref:Methyltransferase domain-containing protein n=1 Tax=Campylobacter majalis TaxID=2790656 RepID=A0ABM8Q680_9BACT|nr:class I SAM-dependent methyltransferase [Campylobacter majalis]CAD7288323.1 hypothetical protein LMG7974_00946 [Campylobacter majalis]
MKTNIDSIDFNELYKAQRDLSLSSVKTQDDWDKKAPSFNESALKSTYADEFLNLVNLHGVSSVLDFACGAGALSLKVAKLVDRVYAYDYSEQMLYFLNQNAKNEEIKNIKTEQKAFEDSWDEVPICDVVFASRCLEVDDLKAVVSKLISKAKRSVYMSFKVQKSFVEKEILTAINRKVQAKPNFIYLINILVGMGYLPRVEYIYSPNCSKILCEDDLMQKVQWSLNDTLNKDEIKALKEYYQSGKKAYEAPMIWAFIAIDLDKKVD